ncbi:Thermostable monoacylglycerol lipase [Botrimarina colliarenosi]|uniref:Thermostable monoacylglycerol lipase n=1 Tax=Botrimarina colliarenosi TaxID=2528001 RepID=A0A5C6ANY4_9BACT|nr:alpha/beta fold hydrolase [Botrimarina colliarenosi]TWU00732.1 Thermostable monoacylglycerol lipase [Botrimarina colliarenosi]
MTDEVENQPRRRWWRVIGLVALAIVPLHLAIDAAYSAYVARAAAGWEATTDRNADGVLEGCESYDLPAAGDAPTNTAILLVHGTNASPRHYDYIAPALAERGYHCRVVRLPGFAEPVAKYSQTTAAQWLATVRDELASLRGRFDRVGVVGHSLGGAVTIGVLLDDPDAADFAVLLAPAIKVSSARSPLLSTRAWHEISEWTFVFTHVLHSPFPLDCRDPEKTSHPGGTPFTPRAVVDQLFTLMDANAPRAADLTTPVIVVVAGDDHIVDTPAIEAYYEQIGATDKRLVELPKSGHEVTLDWEWRDVVNAITEGVSMGTQTASRPTDDASGAAH